MPCPVSRYQREAASVTPLGGICPLIPHRRSSALCVPLSSPRLINGRCSSWISFSACAPVSTSSRSVSSAGPRMINSLRMTGRRLCACPAPTADNSPATSWTKAASTSPCSNKRSARPVPTAKKRISKPKSASANGVTNSRKPLLAVEVVAATVRLCAQSELTPSTQAAASERQNLEIIATNLSAFIRLGWFCLRQEGSNSGIFDAREKLFG